MPEEELNQELSTDELKDVAGGLNQGLGKYFRSEKGKSNKSRGITNGGNGTLSAEDLGKECRGMGLDRLGTQ